MNSHQAKPTLILTNRGAENPIDLQTVDGRIVARVWGTGKDSVASKEANARVLVDLWNGVPPNQIARSPHLTNAKVSLLHKGNLISLVTDSRNVIAEVAGFESTANDLARTTDSLQILWNMFIEFDENASKEVSRNGLLGESLAATKVHAGNNRPADRSEFDEFCKKASIKIFFDALKQFYIQSITAGNIPIAIQLGRSRSPFPASSAAASALNFREIERTGKDLMAATSTHPDAVSFFEWCKESGLEIKLTPEHDGIGVESWVNLTVEPSEAIVSRMRNMVSAQAIVDADRIKEFGSLQGYIEHLESQINERPRQRG